MLDDVMLTFGIAFKISFPKSCLMFIGKANSLCIVWKNKSAPLVGKTPIILNIGRLAEKSCLGVTV